MLKRWRGRYRTLNTIRVFRDALFNNLELYRKLLPGQAVCPVLKSNAYGHGLVEVAKVMESAKVEMLILDSLYEAYSLKKAGIKTPILILGYSFPENLKRQLPFQFTASDLDMAKHLAQLGLPTHLEVDTGMSRMGFSLEELPAALKELKALKLNMVGLFTHFADADNADSDFTHEQSKRFEEAIQLVKEVGFDPKWIHCGNSAGSIKTENPELNMARLGIGLYGVNPLQPNDPFHSKLKDLELAMEFESTLIAVKQIKQGETVSYARSFQAPEDMTIGVIPVGYYEGLPIQLSNSRDFLGRICMNHSMVNLQDKTSAKIGDPYMVYSRTGKHTILEAATIEKSIPYEILTSLSESIRREVV